MIPKMPTGHMFSSWLYAPGYNYVIIAACGIGNGIPVSIPQKVREDVSVYPWEEFGLTS